MARTTLTLAEPRYEIHDLVTGRYITGIYHWANLAPEVRFQRRFYGRHVYVIDREDRCASCGEVLGE